MALNYSPKIITDGLILALDAADKIHTRKLELLGMIYPETGIKLQCLI